MHTLTFTWKSKKSSENFYEFKCNIIKKFVKFLKGGKARKFNYYD